jgi:hypothetical protein
MYSCTPTLQEVKGLEQKLTVGQHVYLDCTGEATALDTGKAFFKNGAVKLFKAESDSQALKIDMTFYTAGVHDLGKLVLTDGSTEVTLGGPQITVESVLQPGPDGKPPEGFDSIFPLALNVPLAYWLYLAGAILLVAVYLIIKGKRLAYYSKLKAGLVKYSSPVEPDTQFYKAVRAAEKAGYPLEQLEKAFRLYNVRAYKLPLFELPDEKIQRYFRRNYPEQKNTRIALQKILNEFSELAAKKESVAPEQKNELVKKIYRYVEKNRGLEP